MDARSFVADGNKAVVRASRSPAQAFEVTVFSSTSPPASSSSTSSRCLQIVPYCTAMTAPEESSSTDRDFSAITTDEIRSFRYLDMHRYMDHAFKDLVTPEELYKLKSINLNGIDYLEGTWTDFWINRLGLGYAAARSATRDVCRLLKIEDDIPNRLEQSNSLITIPRFQDIPPYIKTLVGLSVQFTQALQEEGANPPWAVFHNPGTLTTLPYPRIGIVLTSEGPESIFNLTVNGLLYFFTFHGRHISSTIRDAVNKLSSGPAGRGRHAGVWMIGTEGFGKSMELAKLAISLIATRCRVIYIPSSRECAANPVSYLIPAFILAYGHDSKLVEEIARFQSKESISKFCRDRADSNDYIHFLIDGYEALETNAGTSVDQADDLKRVTKAVTREWLISISAPPHYRVFCSASNHISAHEMLSKPDSCGYIPIYLRGGYLRPEIEAWWNRIPEDSTELNKKDRKMIELVTGNVPSLLKLAAKPGHGGDCWRKLRSIADEARFFSANLLRNKSPAEFRLYQEFVKACIFRKSVEPRIAHDLVDHRYFYRQADGMGRCTNLVVSDAIFRWLEEKQPGLFKPEEFNDMVKTSASNPSVIGFAVEAACITSIASTGLPIAKTVEGVRAGVPILMKLFSEKYPNMLTDDAGATLHCPALFNFPHIDAIICSREPRSSLNLKKKPRLVTLIPLQITLDPSTHSDSETGFFKNHVKWRSGWTSEWRFEFLFIWIGGKEPGLDNVPQNSLGFDHPEFTRITIPFAQLDQTISSILEDSKVRIGVKRKLKEAPTRRSIKKTMKSKADIDS